MLVNDLITLIATYTTPSITNDLLTIDPSLARTGYTYYFWYIKLYTIRKAVVRSQAQIAYKQLYFYYRVLNNINYGKAYELNDDLSIRGMISDQAISIYDDYLYQIVALATGDIYQYSHETNIRSEIYIPHKIIRIFYDLLTERGEFITVTTINNNNIIQIINIVDNIIYNIIDISYGYVLTRSGEIYPIPVRGPAGRPKMLEICNPLYAESLELYSVYPIYRGDYNEAARTYEYVYYDLNSNGKVYRVVENGPARELRLPFPVIKIVETFDGVILCLLTNGSVYYINENQYITTPRFLYSNVKDISGESEGIILIY